MNDFMYYNPVRVHFGADAMSHLPEELGKFGANVLLTYGGGSIKRTGLYDRVLDALRAAGKSVYELSGIMPNPRTEKVYEGIELCRKHKIDLILAVGGGSTIDCSKAIAVGAPGGGRLLGKVLCKLGERRNRYPSRRHSHHSGHGQRAGQVRCYHKFRHRREKLL